eukprot:c5814_g1_i1.p1 GENE.c5814_g1_i1~~c5814_g1_i1.p1  ORF type:complete len:135 (+),score=52.11 c5814_g1_i1:23-406(+)
MAKHVPQLFLKSVSVRFAAFDRPRRSNGIREFWRQIDSDSWRGKNGNLELSIQIHNYDESPVLGFELVDGQKIEMDVGNMTVKEIIADLTGRTRSLHYDLLMKGKPLPTSEEQEEQSSGAAKKKAKK